MTRIQTIINGISRLTPMPRVATQIMEMAGDPECSMDQVVDLITHDAVVTANILKTVNSAYYRRSKPIDSIHQATVFLGMDDVVDLTLLSGSAENLKRPQEGYGLKGDASWCCAVTSALVARRLASANAHCDIHLVYTGALLKDIGKVVLSQYVSEGFERINALVKDRNHSFREAEKKVIGIDHAELGAMVAQVWQFSPKMIDIIAHHHDPSNAELAPKETAMVHLSDVLCMMVGVGGGRDGLAYRFHRDTIDILGMSDIDFQSAIACVVEEQKNAETLMV